MTDENAIDVVFEDERWGALSTKAAFADEICADIAAKIYAQLPQLNQTALPGCSILLTSDDAVRVLNNDFRGKDKVTDVLSFPAEERTPATANASFIADYLGDIALAYESVQGEADTQGKTLYAHTVHLLTHGILHLLGYDHEETAEAERMEQKERDILRTTFAISDPYNV